MRKRLTLSDLAPEDRPQAIMELLKAENDPARRPRKANLERPLVNPLPGGESAKIGPSDAAV